MNNPILTTPSTLFCSTCSIESPITNGLLDCCGKKIFEKTIPCLQCHEPTVQSRSAKKFCSSKCRVSFYSEFDNPRIKDCCTISQLAEFSGLRPATIRKRIKAGEILAHKIGPLYLVPKSALRLNRKPKPPTTTPEFVRPEITQAFQLFTTARHLSRAGLANACGISRTSAHRLLTGTCSKDFFEKIKPLLPKEIIDHLA